MNKIVSRLLTFFIGVPAVIVIILIPFYRHLALHIVVILYTAIGAVELASMLEKKQLFIPKAEAFILGAIMPFSLMLIISFEFPQWVLPLSFMAAVTWILISRIFSKQKEIDSFVNYIAAGIFVFFYPGFFISWLSKMTAWENAGIIILVFILSSIGSDSLAWLMGNVFGKNNRGIIPVSPNKSIVGFIGGLLGSIIIICGAVIIAPDIFSVRENFLPVPLVIAIFGICIGISTELGDLAESSIKRSCGVKDSGKLMQGRGGILDTIDSIAFTAPVYYVLFNLFFVNQ